MLDQLDDADLYPPVNNVILVRCINLQTNLKLNVLLHYL